MDPPTRTDKIDRLEDPWAAELSPLGAEFKERF